MASALDGERVITFGQRGTIRSFNFKTQEQLQQINLGKNIDIEIFKIKKYTQLDGT